MIHESLKNCKIFYDYSDSLQLNVVFIFFGYSEISDINLLIGRNLYFESDSSIFFTETSRFFYFAHGGTGIVNSKNEFEGSFLLTGYLEESDEDEFYEAQLNVEKIE